jgi:hypothetical protein
VKLMWIPSHVGLVGNELFDKRTGGIRRTGGISRLHLRQTIIHSLARPTLMRAWQEKWESTDTGRFAHFFCRCDTLVLIRRPKEGKMLCLHCVKGFTWTLLCSIALW